MSNYDEKGNGSHYKKGKYEVIEMMEKIWGIDAVITYCEITIFKYRMRLGHKDASELELTKIKWYEDKIQELSKKKDEHKTGIKPKFKSDTGGIFVHATHITCEG